MNEEISNLLAQIEALRLEHQARGNVVGEMRDSLQRIEAGILELGKRMHEQDEILRQLKKGT